VIVKAAELRATALPGRTSADPFGPLDDAQLSMRVVDVGPGARSPHRHPHSYEAMFVVHGSGHLWEDGRVYRVEPGDCILVPRDVPHATIPDEGTHLRLVCFFPHPDLASNIQELEGTIEPSERDAPK
jgi:quercetin dioxygenase-like cupin family protein